MAEAERLSHRVAADLAELQSRGFCRGLENYSRHFSGRAPGEPPTTLMDYSVHSTGIHSVHRPSQRSQRSQRSQASPPRL